MRLTRLWPISVSAVLALGCTDAAPPVDKLAHGKQLYGQYCALCHGPNGEGYAADAANALNHPQFLATASNAFLWASIERGRPATPMSAWGQRKGGPLSDGDLDAVVSYIRTWQRGASVDLSHDPTTSGLWLRAQAAYDVECSSCHGENGKGGKFMSIANAEFLAKVSDGYLRRVIANGRDGTAMPGFGGVLPEQYLDDLVALLRHWQIQTAEFKTELPAPWPKDPVLNRGHPPPDFAKQSAFFVPAAEVQFAMDSDAEMQILDARPPADYPAYHIKGAVSVPFYAAAQYAPKLDKNVWTVTYCACPHAESSSLAKALQAAGFSKVRVLDEGLPYWFKQGWPVSQGPLP